MNVNIYESNQTRSTNTFFKECILADLQAGKHVFYIDTINGFNKYQIDESQYQNLSLVQSNDLTMMINLIKTIKDSDLSLENVVIYIDHFECAKSDTDHPLIEPVSTPKYKRQFISLLTQYGINTHITAITYTTLSDQHMQSTLPKFAYMKCIHHILNDFSIPMHTLLP